MDQSVNNVKQEPEATFLVILPQALVQQPINEIKIEQNSAKIKIKIRKCDHRRSRKMKLFQTYQKCEKCGFMVYMNKFKNHSKKCFGRQKLGQNFECDHCGRFFKKRDYLYTHMKLHMKLLVNGNRFSCDKCGTEFKRKEHLVKHLVRSTNRMTKCFLCDKEFECKILKDRHLKEGHKKDLKCPKCDFVAKDFRKLQKHHYKRVHDMQFSCVTCSKKYRENSLLTDHQLKHKHGIYKPTTFDCNRCTNSFSTNKHLKFHQRYAHGKETFQCDLCSKILVSRSQIYYHMQSHIRVPCHICKKIVGKTQLNDHQKTHTTDKPSHKCNQCRKSYSTRRYLLKHIRNCHNKFTTEDCHICKKAVKKANFKKHLESHSKPRDFSRDSLEKQSGNFERNQNFECDLCAGFYRTKNNLSKHMKIHVKFFCGKCGKGFKTKGGFVQHQKQNNRIFKCYLCDKEFECRNLKDQHMREVHKKDFKCPKCQFIGKNYQRLKEHHRRVHKKHPCETCSKKFPTQSRLKHHQLQRKNGRCKETSSIFDCNQCTNSYATIKSLQWHQKKVHGEEDLQCDFCSKIWKSKRLLVEHLRTHIKLQCHICKKSFTRRDSLFRHIKSVHSYSKLSLQCDLCGKTFKSMLNLRQHFDNHKKVPCSICHKVFNKSSIRRHFLRHSRVIPCKFCSLKFSFKRKLYRHVKKEHS